MKQTEKNEAREERIEMEIVVDAYGEEERAMGWYCFLQDTLQFPFKAKCVAERVTSPLQVGEKVEVTALTDADECDHEMFVGINWQGRDLAVPLMQLEPLDADEDTQEAIADWHYWIARGYLF